MNELCPQPWIASPKSRTQTDQIAIIKKISGCIKEIANISFEDNNEMHQKIICFGDIYKINACFNLQNLYLPTAFLKSLSSSSKILIKNNFENKTN